MAKLFALEAQHEDVLQDSGPLLIDKVLEYDKRTKQGVSVTADLLKQRHDLREQITQELNEQSQDDANNDTPSSQASATDDDQDPDELSSDQKGDASPEAGAADDAPSSSESGHDPAPDESKTQPKVDKPADGESEESLAADDVQSLKGLVGQGSAKPVAAESLKSPAKRSKSPSEPLGVIGLHSALRSLFEPLKDAHRRRLASLESFALTDKPKVTEQPLAYVSAQVVESLNRLISLASQYLQKNTGAIAQGHQGLKDLGEKLTAYKEYTAAQKFHFTQSLVQDKELLSALSVKDKNELSYTSGLLCKHLEEGSALAVKLLKNPFEQIPDAFIAAGYQDNQQGLYVKEQMLPGFQTLQASVVPFTNYIETHYEEYQVYKVQVLKPQDLYSLPALSLDQDKDLRKLLSELDRILISCALILDNLQVIGQSYTQFIEAAKGLVYDVQKGEQKDLASLGLNERLQDFIKYKLVTEVYLIDFDLGVRYLSAAVSVLSELVELSDQ